MMNHTLKKYIAQIAAITFILSDIGRVCAVPSRQELHQDHLAKSTFYGVEKADVTADEYRNIVEIAFLIERVFSRLSDFDQIRRHLRDAFPALVALIERFDLVNVRAELTVSSGSEIIKRPLMQIPLWVSPTQSVEIQIGQTKFFRRNDDGQITHVLADDGTLVPADGWTLNRRVIEREQIGDRFFQIVESVGITSSSGMETTPFVHEKYFIWDFDGTIAKYGDFRRGIVETIAGLKTRGARHVIATRQDAGYVEGTLLHTKTDIPVEKIYDVSMLGENAFDNGKSYAGVLEDFGIDEATARAHSVIIGDEFNDLPRDMDGIVFILTHKMSIHARMIERIIDLIDAHGNGDFASGFKNLHDAAKLLNPDRASGARKFANEDISFLMLYKSWKTLSGEPLMFPMIFEIKKPGDSLDGLFVSSGTEDELDDIGRKVLADLVQKRIWRKASRAWQRGISKSKERRGSSSASPAFIPPKPVDTILPDEEPILVQTPVKPAVNYNPIFVADQIEKSGHSLINLGMLRVQIIAGEIVFFLRIDGNHVLFDMYLHRTGREHEYVGRLDMVWDQQVNRYVMKGAIDSDVAFNTSGASEYAHDNNITLDENSPAIMNRKPTAGTDDSALYVDEALLERLHLVPYEFKAFLALMAMNLISMTNANSIGFSPFFENDDLEEFAGYTVGAPDGSIDRYYNLKNTITKIRKALAERVIKFDPKKWADRVVLKAVELGLDGFTRIPIDTGEIICCLRKGPDQELMFDFYVKPETYPHVYAGRVDLTYNPDGGAYVTQNALPWQRFSLKAAEFLTSNRIHAGSDSSDHQSFRVSNAYKHHALVINSEVEKLGLDPKVMDHAFFLVALEVLEAMSANTIGMDLGSKYYSDAFAGLAYGNPPDDIFVQLYDLAEVSKKLSDKLENVSSGTEIRVRNIKDIKTMQIPNYRGDTQIGPVFKSKRMISRLVIMRDKGAHNPHKHQTSEYQIILGGQGRAHVGNETRVIQRGSFVRIPSGAVHWTEQTGGESLYILSFRPAGSNYEEAAQQATSEIQLSGNIISKTPQESRISLFGSDDIDFDLRMLGPDDGYDEYPPFANRQNIVVLGGSARLEAPEVGQNIILNEGDVALLPQEHTLNIKNNGSDELVYVVSKLSSGAEAESIFKKFPKGFTASPIPSHTRKVAAGVSLPKPSRLFGWLGKTRPIIDSNQVLSVTHASDNHNTPYFIKAALTPERAMGLRFEFDALSRLTRSELSAGFPRPYAMGAVQGNALYNEFFIHSGATYLATEFLERAGNIDFEFSQYGPVNFTKQVAHLIREIHRSGYVHREINPRHIRAAKGGLKIVDFDGALPAGLDLSKLKQFKFTEHYSDTTWNQTVDFRQDIYSFGMTMYRLWRGILPHEVEGDDKFEEFRKANPEMARIIAKSIAPIHERYQNIDELIADLDKLPGEERPPFETEQVSSGAEDELIIEGSDILAEMEGLMQKTDQRPEDYEKLYERIETAISKLEYAPYAESMLNDIRIQVFEDRQINRPQAIMHAIALYMLAGTQAADYNSDQYAKIMRRLERTIAIYNKLQKKIFVESNRKDPPLYLSMPLLFEMTLAAEFLNEDGYRALSWALLKLPNNHLIVGTYIQFKGIHLTYEDSELDVIDVEIVRPMAEYAITELLSGNISDPNTAIALKRALVGLLSGAESLLDSTSKEKSGTAAGNAFVDMIAKYNGDIQRWIDEVRDIDAAEEITIADLGVLLHFHIFHYFDDIKETDEPIAYDEYLRHPDRYSRELKKFFAILPDMSKDMFFNETDGALKNFDEWKDYLALKRRQIDAYYDGRGKSIISSLKRYYWDGQERVPFFFKKRNRAQIIAYHNQLKAKVAALASSGTEELDMVRKFDTILSQPQAGETLDFINGMLAPDYELKVMIDGDNRRISLLIGEDEEHAITSRLTGEADKLLDAEGIFSKTESYESTISFLHLDRKLSLVKSDPGSLPAMYMIKVHIGPMSVVFTLEDDGSLESWLIAQDAYSGNIPHYHKYGSHAVGYGGYTESFVENPDTLPIVFALREDFSSKDHYLFTLFIPGQDIHAIREYPWPKSIPTIHRIISIAPVQLPSGLLPSQIDVQDISRLVPSLAVKYLDKDGTVHINVITYSSGAEILNLSQAIDEIHRLNREEGITHVQFGKENTKWVIRNLRPQLMAESLARIIGPEGAGFRVNVTKYRSNPIVQVLPVSEGEQVSSGTETLNAIDLIEKAEREGSGRTMFLFESHYDPEALKAKLSRSVEDAGIVVIEDIPGMEILFFKVSTGTLTPEEALQQSQSIEGVEIPKPAQNRLKVLFETLYNKNVYVIRLETSGAINVMSELRFANAVLQSRLGDFVVTENKNSLVAMIGDFSAIAVRAYREIDREIRRRIDEIRGIPFPFRHSSPNADILVVTGAVHTTPYIEMKKENPGKVSRDFETMPFVYTPLHRFVRYYLFKGGFENDQEFEDMALRAGLYVFFSTGIRDLEPHTRHSRVLTQLTDYIVDEGLIEEVTAYLHHHKDEENAPVRILIHFLTLYGRGENAEILIKNLQELLDGEKISSGAEIQITEYDALGNEIAEHDHMTETAFLNLPAGHTIKVRGRLDDYGRINFAKQRDKWTLGKFANHIVEITYRANAKRGTVITDFQVLFDQNDWPVPEDKAYVDGSATEYDAKGNAIEWHRTINEDKFAQLAAGHTLKIIKKLDKQSRFYVTKDIRFPFPNRNGFVGEVTYKGKGKQASPVLIAGRLLYYPEEENYPEDKKVPERFAHVDGSATEYHANGKIKEWHSNPSEDDLKNMAAGNKIVFIKKLDSHGGYSVAGQKRIFESSKYPYHVARVTHRQFARAEFPTITQAIVILNDSGRPLEINLQAEQTSLSSGAETELWAEAEVFFGLNEGTRAFRDYIADNGQIRNEFLRDFLAEYGKRTGSIWKPLVALYALHVNVGADRLDYKISEKGIVYPIYQAMDILSKGHDIDIEYAQEGNWFVLAGIQRRLSIHDIYEGRIQQAKHVLRTNGMVMRTIAAIIHAARSSLENENDAMVVLVDTRRWENEYRVFHQALQKALEENNLDGRVVLESSRDDDFRNAIIRAKRKTRENIVKKAVAIGGKDALENFSQDIAELNLGTDVDTLQAAIDYTVFDLLGVSWVAGVLTVMEASFSHLADRYISFNLENIPAIDTIYVTGGVMYVKFSVTADAEEQIINHHKAEIEQLKSV